MNGITRRYTIRNKSRIVCCDSKKIFKKSPEVSIVDELTRVRSVVVLMPNDPEQFKAAKNSLLKLTGFFFLASA